ncbi:PREDICTED: putative uncharacterized protein CXorf42 isoform X3 [Cercocebus atys]|uniref:putative uncharacterized protein CXorf42 isoform X3 n=1 Tax=Cercocebus atys TaxID=9531 RepID=UPI0005F449AE|nr:PREDICTED: putative uncharacterized protein CXorf42 isoform X3 [Cercocebus atys]
MCRFRSCSSSSVLFCSAEREASGSGEDVLQFVQEPQGQQSLPFPAGEQLSLERLLSDWGMEWAQSRLPKPALLLPLVVPFSRAALCAAGHDFRFCLLVRLLRQLLTLLRDEDREVSPWQSSAEHMQVENEEPKKCTTSVSTSEGVHLTWRRTMGKTLSHFCAQSFLVHVICEDALLQIASQCFFPALLRVWVYSSHQPWIKCCMRDT